MVEVSLEDDQVGYREVEEEVGSLGVEVPVGESRAPEGVLFVDLENTAASRVSIEGAYWFRSGRFVPTYPDSLFFLLLSDGECFQFLHYEHKCVKKHTFHLRPSFLSDLSS